MGAKDAAVQSVDRAITILEMVAARGELGITEIAEELDVHKSTASRLVAALQHRSLLEQLGERGKYTLSFGVVRLAAATTGRLDVARLGQPVCQALAESLGVSPRPFLIAVMMGASAAFATPFGYQTNVLVYQMGKYSYADFVRVGLPLNLLTWLVGVLAIRFFFPF